MGVPIYNSAVNSSHSWQSWILLALLTSDVDETSYFPADTELHYILLLQIQNIDCWGFSGLGSFLVQLFWLNFVGLIFALC